MLPDSVLTALEDRIVNEVPSEDGFWGSTAEDAYISAGKKLLDAGWQANDIIDMLTSLYYGAKSEFGG